MWSIQLEENVFKGSLVPLYLIKACNSAIYRSSTFEKQNIKDQEPRVYT